MNYDHVITLGIIALIWFVARIQAGAIRRLQDEVAELRAAMKEKP